MSKGDTPIGEYGNEYMLVLEVVEVEDPGRGEGGQGGSVSGVCG